MVLRTIITAAGGVLFGLGIYMLYVLYGGRADIPTTFGLVFTMLVAGATALVGLILLYFAYRLLEAEYTQPQAEAETALTESSNVYFFPARLMHRWNRKVEKKPFGVLPFLFLLVPIVLGVHVISVLIMYEVSVTTLHVSVMTATSILAPVMIILQKYIEPTPGYKFLTWALMGTLFILWPLWLFLQYP